MGVIKHRIIIVLKIANIILLLLSTQIPLNNNRIYNFQKITEPSSFKYPTRILCCASLGKKIKKICKEVFCGLVEDYSRTQHHRKTQHYGKNQHDDESQYDSEFQYDDDSQYDSESQHDGETQPARKTKRYRKNRHDRRSQYFGRPRTDDELMIGGKSQSNENWDGTHKSKLNYNDNTANDIDLKLINSKEIRKALIPFRVTDEEIEKAKRDKLMDLFNTGEIYITPKVASLVFYNFHMKIHKDINILWKRGKKIINRIVIEHNMTYEQHTLRIIEVKRMLYDQCVRIKHESLSLFQDYALTFKDQLDSTFHLFLKEHYLKMRQRFLKINRAFYMAANKAAGTSHNEQLILISEDENELFYFT
ncbi:Plasmodium exported protein, unknown function [Plasmodium vinckei lentum]|uniref:Plasmodium RESA N-terminal domain-containing protein n=1 Tax=Plasmodium vinckei lentum TaxID=138297 RepID=A0A6V7SG04_PLAVN|nr:Plasmodium exported protein, unknown function [Plasmodium vinckei lentum]